MKKLHELRDHVFRPLIYLTFFVIIIIALFFSGRGLARHEARATFTDIDKENWAFEAVQYLAGTGCMSGYEVDGKQHFDPTRPMTRAEVAQVIYCINQ